LTQFEGQAEIGLDIGLQTEFVIAEVSSTAQRYPLLQPSFPALPNRRTRQDCRQRYNQSSAQPFHLAYTKGRPS